MTLCMVGSSTENHDKNGFAGVGVLAGATLACCAGLLPQPASQAGMVSTAPAVCTNRRRLKGFTVGLRWKKSQSCGFGFPLDARRWSVVARRVHRDGSCGQGNLTLAKVRPDDRRTDAFRRP